jgi:acyl-CoA synthetase (NDP forming)
LSEALFAPRAVALIGASGDPRKNTARPQRYLAKHGYRGRIVPINATRQQVLGEKAYPSLAAAPGEIDHALIMVEDVEQALEDCARRGVTVASIFSDGFADAGPEGAARQARLVERARSLGVRLLGPNSMGVIDLPGRLALSVNAVLEMDTPRAGTTSLISQSGTMLGTILSRGAARGLGFAKLVSVGNEADLGLGELVGLLAEDPHTQVILLFLETVRDAARLARAARTAHAAGKPIIAYKLGRSQAGERLARSHTGALAGTDAALDAFFRDCGILRVDLLETLIEIAPLVSGRRPPALARAPRVAVVTTTGGGAATVVDRLGMQGIETSEFVDLTMGSGPHDYSATLARLLDSPQADAAIAVVGSSAQFHPEVAVEPILRARSGEKPLAAFFTPHAERSLALVGEHGIAAFRTPEACADAFAAYFAWRVPRERPSLSPPLRAQNPFELFASLGIPVVEQVLVHAPDFTHSLAYPVALKMLDLEHKTEAGGVVLNIASDAELKAHAAKLARARLLVQRMEHGLGEAIVGYRADPVVGPIVLVGAGGTLAEIYQDFAIDVAPVSEEEALRMIEKVKGLAPIRGYRNLPRGDVQALAHAVSALSRLAMLDEISEAEINPLIVKLEGVVAVDGLVVRKS